MVMSFPFYSYLAKSLFSNYKMTLKLLDEFPRSVEIIIYFFLFIYFLFVKLSPILIDLSEVEPLFHSENKPYMFYIFLKTLL